MRAHFALAALAALALVACDDDGSSAEPAVDYTTFFDAEPADATLDAAPDAGALIETYEALAAPVEIRVDESGLTHIYAQDDRDLFFAAGYQQAADRLFAIDMNRRAALGTTAEVLGEQGFAGDVAARTIGFGPLGDATLAAVGAARPDDHALVVAFAGGINRRIAEVNAGDAPLPPEYTALGIRPRPVTPGELLAIGVRITFGFSSLIEQKLLYTLLGRLAPGASETPVFAPVGDAFMMVDPDDVPAEAPAALPADFRAPALPFDRAAADALVAGLRTLRQTFNIGDGSNNWVIHGDHTDTGRPYLANDSHASLGDPNQMWLIHLDSASAGGRWDAVGMAFTGVPGVHVGHNRHLAWGATTNFGDMVDLWDVRIRDGIAQVGGEEIPVEETPETIQIRTPDGAFEARELTVQRIPGRGVVIPPEMLDGIPYRLIVNGALVIDWPGFTPGTELFTYFDMARAPDLDAWVDAVEEQRTGMFNWLAASADGIRYHTSGLVPDRGPPDGRPPVNRVLDGSDPTTLWTGEFLGPEHLPSLDGSQPYIYTANNDPWGHTADNDPLDDPFYYGSFFSPGFRAERLQGAFAERVAAGPVDRAQMEALQTETYSPWADRVLAMLPEAIAALDVDDSLAPYDREDLRAAADRLLAWDRHLDLDAREGALWRIWAEFLGYDIMADDLGLLYAAIADAQPVYVSKFGLLLLEQRVESLLDAPREQLLLAALDRALATHIERGEPTWGELHRAVLTRPDRTTRQLPMAADDSSLNVAQSRCGDGDGGLAERCLTNAGAVYRMVTGFADDGTPEMTFACPACLADGDDDWVQGRFRPLPFRRADVDAATVETRTLD